MTLRQAQGEAPPTFRETIALAERVARGGSIKHGSVTREALALAVACLRMREMLGKCWLNDRSAPYAPGEARPDGTAPPAEGDEEARWLAPREIAEAVLTGRLPAFAEATAGQPAEAPGGAKAGAEKIKIGGTNEDQDQAG